MAAESDLDTEMMISLIQDRPALWDKTSPVYKDRIAKRNGWEQVCAALNANFQGMEENKKSKYEEEVVKKWNNVRDYFAKSCKNIKASKRSRAKGKLPKKYIFNDQLSFIKKIYESRPTEESFNNGENYEDDEGENNGSAEENDATSSESPTSIRSTSFRTHKTSRKRRRQPDKIELRMLKVVENENPNRHLSFFQGVIPALDGFNEDDIIQFQHGVLDTIQRIRRQKQNIPSSSSYFHPNYTSWSALLWQPTLSMLTETGTNGPYTYNSYSQPLYSSADFNQSPSTSTSTQPVPSSLNDPRLRK